MKTGARLGLAALVASLVLGCSVPVASLDIAMPPPVSANVATLPLVSRGWQEGTSCRFWVVGVKARAHDWDPIRGLHQGQRSWCRANRPHT